MPTPGRGEVRIRVHACGVCHSDLFVTDGLWPGLALPRVPGHEIAGVIDAVGEDVARFKPGDRVGVGWHGGHDGTCAACLRGQFMFCEKHAVTGIAFDGGYAEQVVVPAVAVARIPDGLGFADAAPLLCAGVTTFNALRNAGARAGRSASPCTASAGSATWACSTRAPWASRWSRSRAAPRRRPSPRSSARSSTSTASASMPAAA